MRTLIAIVLQLVGLLILVGGWFSWTGTHTHQSVWMGITMSCLGIQLSAIATVIAPATAIGKLIRIITATLLIVSSFGVLNAGLSYWGMRYWHISSTEADYVSNIDLLYPSLVGALSVANLIVLSRSGVINRGPTSTRWR